MATHDNETLTFMTLLAATKNVLELLKPRHKQDAADHGAKRNPADTDGEDQRSKLAVR